MQLHDGKEERPVREPRSTRFSDCIDSVVFMLQGQGSDQPWSVAAADLGAWINRYQTWFIEAIEAEKGHNLHRLYNREVLLSGYGLGDNMGEFDVLTAAVRAHRLGLVWSMSLPELVALHAELIGRVEAGLLPSISVTIDSNDANLDQQNCCTAFETIAASGCQLQFVGELKVLEQLGVLDLPSINRANITHNPRNLSLVGDIMRTARARPCRSRFRLFVAPDGVIYPCVPMMGLAQCALGTIHQPIADVVGGKASILDLDHLAQNGPSLPQTLAGNCRSGLPLECELHREKVQQETA